MVVSRNRVAIGVAAVGLTVVACFVALRWTSDGRPEAGTTAPVVDEPGTTTAVAVAAPGADLHRVVPEAVERVLRVVDAADRRPLEGAVVAAWQGTHVPATLPPAAISVVADEAGRVRWRQREPEDTVIVRCAGYVPGVFRLSPSATGDLELVAAARLTVEVIDELGRPVADATVCLTTSAATPFLAADAVLTPGIGHPLSDSPQWLGATDGTGRVSFAEVPPGRLHLSVLSETHVPTGTLGAGEALALYAGHQTVTVVVAEASAVVFATQGAAKVTRVSWLFDRNMVDTAIHVVTRTPRIRSALQRRFPDCQVLVHHVARPDAEVVVTCHAQLEDNTLMRGAWPLQRISTIDSPVQMERMPGVHHAITVRLQDSSGREFPGIRVRLGDRETGFFLDTETGAATVVPEGNYRVTPGRLEVLQAFQDLVVHVHAAGPREFVATVPHVLSEVVTEIELPGGECLGPLTIEVRTEVGQAPAVFNWRPHHGPPRHLVQGKLASVRIWSPFYETFELKDQPLSRDAPTTLRAKMVVKPASR